jgi:hypothetical protein
LNWSRSPASYLKRERDLALRNYPWEAAARHLAMSPDASCLFEVAEERLGLSSLATDTDIDSISAFAREVMGQVMVLKFRL